jgi:hypothetical protein
MEKYVKSHEQNTTSIWESIFKEIGSLPRAPTSSQPKGFLLPN